MGALDRVLLAAGDGEQYDEQAVHEHLMKECPWYTAIGKGENPGDPESYCRPATRGEVKLTPRTPEASTVDKPTVPPGGPGLFHVKGLHLPPYFQHLWFHLVKEYGKHKAYGVAVGIVKKWAAGINPGGKHPTKTHPDVQAAAARNVALWHEDEAKAHAQSREHEHVKATVVLAADFPGDKLIPLPPVPHDKTAAAMFTAHRTGDIINQMSHAAERVDAAGKAPTPALRHYYSIHIANHATLATRSGQQLLDNIRRNYPAVARELSQLNKVVGCSVALSPRAKTASFAHLAETVMYNLGHAKRHADALLDDDPGNEKLWRFNLDHASRHINGTLEHILKLAEHLRDNYPAEAHWLKMLEGYQGREAGEAGKPEGEDSYDKKPTVKLAMPVATAPGAKPIQPRETPPDYGLFRKPYAPGGAPIALPPGANIPTAAEVRKLAGMVPDCSDASLAESAREHLKTAAMQLDRHSILDALSTLRAAQMDAFAGHKADLGAASQNYYTANVFEKTVPPAETSSAHATMIASQQRRMDWRKLQQGIALAIDKIKRHFFHGELGSWATQARFSQEDGELVPLAARLAQAD